MTKRILTSLFLMLVGMPALLFGGVLFYLLVAFFLGVAAWEYVRLYRAVQAEPSMVLVVGGTLLVLTVRAFFPEYAMPVLTILVILAMAVHMLAFERGRDLAARDFSITLGGLVYVGWIGAYLYDLRALPNGGWWLFIVLGSVWMADSGAYSIGSAYGKHKMAPRLSPKKSWEGYLVGVFTGALYGAFLTWAFIQYGPMDGIITPLEGGLVGLFLSIIAPFGDLGESMFKRQAHIKDSSDLFPGHGGALDRIDSWLWAAPLGVFLIQLFWL